MENIEFRLMTPNDAEAAIEFLKRHYATSGSPPTVNLQLPPEGVDYLVRGKIQKALKDPEKIMSYLAIDKTTGAIVACDIGFFVYPKEEDKSMESHPIKIDSKTQKYIDYSRLMLSGAHEFLPPDHNHVYAKGDLVLIDPAYRQLGLTRVSSKLWKERCWKVFGCRYAISNATSYVTQELYAKDGWVTLRWINWKDFYVHGKRVFDFGPDSKQKCAKLSMLDVKKAVEKIERMSKL